MEIASLRLRTTFEGTAARRFLFSPTFATLPLFAVWSDRHWSSLGELTLINNAGVYPRKPFLEMSEQEWDDVQETNLKGVFHCTKAVLPHMVERRGGKIVNISSVTFFKGLANLTHYVAAKGGVIGFTRSLAREMGPNNVYVNCITPGAIEVETEKVVATPEQIAAIVAQQSMQRRLKPLDVARVCLFLASHLSDGLTGQTINVDGGLIMH